MHVIERVAELSEVLDAARADGRTVGLVPTMGALHAGHVSLVERAAAECDVVCTTVFVNPLQFAPGEDLDAYPRDLEGDIRRAAGGGATIVFAPSVVEMYPDEVRTTVHVSGLTEVLDGLARPDHFDGVATVVAKLFAMAGRCRAYFGEKDFQQLAVVRRLAADLSFPVAVVGCPIVRDIDGLALSSRNVYLSTDERAAAPVLYKALRSGAALIQAGATDPETVGELMGAIIEAEPTVQAVDYAEVVDAATLQRPTALAGELRLLVAVRFASARLIDNLRCSPAGAGG